MAYIDPTGHSFWDNIKEWIGHAVGAVAAVVGFAASGFTNPLGAFQVYSFVSGAINSAISGDIGAFAITTAASIATAGFAQGVGASVAKATTGLGKSFIRGALIGAAEFGTAGFIAGTVSEYARTGSGSAALRGGIWGAVGGAAFGAAIQGSYVAGWQKVAHGLDMDTINGIDTASKAVKFGSLLKKIGPDRERALAHYYIRNIKTTDKGTWNQYKKFVLKNNLRVHPWTSPIKDVTRHNITVDKWLQPPITDPYFEGKMSARESTMRDIINDPYNLYGNIISIGKDTLVSLW